VKEQEFYAAVARYEGRDVGVCRGVVVDVLEVPGSINPDRVSSMRSLPYSRYCSTRLSS